MYPSRFLGSRVTKNQTLYLALDTHDVFLCIAISNPFLSSIFQDEKEEGRSNGEAGEAEEEDEEGGEGRDSKISKLEADQKAQEAKEEVDLKRD